MKSYKFLVPLLLVVVFAASLYMLIDTKATIQKQYDGFLAEARNYRGQGVDVDAEKNYMLVKGNVPGPKKGLVMVKTTAKKIKHVEPKELLTKEAE